MLEPTLIANDLAACMKLVMSLPLCALGIYSRLVSAPFDPKVLQRVAEIRNGFPSFFHGLGLNAGVAESVAMSHVIRLALGNSKCQFEPQSKHG